jgi:photosystem II stability/assembly factor-like uncharacterized protein
MKLGAVGIAALSGAAFAAPTSGWRVLPAAPFRGKQDDIFFIDASTGWYGNGAGKLYQTFDGGDSWSLSWDRPGTYIRALGFIDRNVGFLGNIGVDYFPGVTDRHPLYRTADAGRSWDPVTNVQGPLPAGVCSIDILRRPFVNAGVLEQRTTIRAGGRVGGPARLMTSHDLGMTWTSEDLSPLTEAILDVHFISERIGFIAGASNADVEQSHAVILRTVDGGGSWQPVYEGARPFEIIWKLSFPTPRVGFATVQNYDPDATVTSRVVARTIDGGSSWTELPVAVDHSLQEFGIGFVDAHRGWIGGSPRGYETRDGGRSWQPADLGRAMNKIRVLRDGPHTRVWAIGVDVRRLDL